MPAAAAISCSRSPSGPACAISCCAVSRISCRATSGVRRTRFTEACIGVYTSLLTLLSVYPKFGRPRPERGTPAMSQATDTRRHPIAAYRAVRALMRDREDTRQVFLLIDALRGKTTLRQFARFRETEIGRAALADRRRLFDRLEDRASLAALPAGTLGRAYYDFMAAENLSAEGLVKASTIPQSTDGIIWFRERNREMHDLLHIVSGYGRDPLGEACLVAFSYAQTGQLGFAVIALFAGRRIAQARRGQPIWRAIFEGYRRGRRAGWLIGADWEGVLNRPVEAIREQYAVRPAYYYPKIIAAICSSGEGTAETRPATAMPA